MALSGLLRSVNFTVGTALSDQPMDSVAEACPTWIGR